MIVNIGCKTNFKIPVGAKGLNEIVFPAVTKKISVSFNVKDCHRTNLDVLAEDQINDTIAIIDTNREVSTSDISQLYMDVFNKKMPTKLSLIEKKILILEAEVMGYILPSTNKDIEYFTKLFPYLSCLTGLEFEIVEEHDQEGLDYKISICSTDNILLDTKGELAHAYVSIEENPTQCLILADYLKDNDPHIIDMKNTLGHEILHCLGLNHPVYKSINENKEHRSMLEDASPIRLKCYRESYNLEKALKCAKLPSMPTGDDICALIDLYGFSTNKSSSCNKIVEDFAAKYPKLLELTGSDSINEEL